MTACHGDEKIVAVQEEVPGAAQRRVERIGPPARGGPLAALLSRSGDGGDLARGEVNAADFVVLGVGHEKLVAAQGHALRLVELGRGEIAVFRPATPEPITSSSVPSSWATTMRL